MEFCNGGDLHEMIHTQGPFSEAKAKPLFRQIGYSLAYLHRHSIAHLDLKPHNVLVCRLPNKSVVLKLGDFGLAQSMHQLNPQSFRGSPLYCAPEIFEKHYDARADLWSAGVILYEMLFKRTPYAAATVDDLLPIIARGDDIIIPESPAITPTCHDLLTRLLQRDPEKRIAFDGFFGHLFVDLEHYPTAECLPK